MIKIQEKNNWLNNPEVCQRLDEIWKTEGNYFQTCFEEVIVVLEAHHKKYKNQITERQFITRRYKDMIGAHGIGKTFINIGLCSEESILEKNQGKKTVKDHVFGYVTIAKKVVCDFIDEKIDENWLEKNFHLWVTIEVSKKEHRKENIQRSDQNSGLNIDYEHKLKLKHYKVVSDLYIKEKFKPRFSNLNYKNELVERRNN